MIRTKISKVLSDKSAMLIQESKLNLSESYNVYNDDPSSNNIDNPYDDQPNEQVEEDDF